MGEIDFKPAWWLPNPHLQTLWPTLFRRRLKMPLKRERFELPDGDFIDLDWAYKKEKDGPIVLVLHGLEGSVQSHYAKGILQTILDHGWRGAFMHFRGCSGEPNRLPQAYHSGETGDVEQIVKILRAREPNVPIAAIGYSLGGNILLKWLGETGKKNPLCAAIAVSVPFELYKAAERIQKGFSKFYQWYLLRCLKVRLKRKFSRVPPSSLDPSILLKVATMFEFDDKVTAPLHGFSGVHEYYTISSSRQYLNSIEKPTLILHAKDDPFMTADTIPDKKEVSPFVQLEITESGGHVGFVTGRYPWSAVYWLEHRIPMFLKDFL